MRKVFIERAKRRIKTAYTILSLALFLIVLIVGLTIIIAVDWAIGSNDYLFSQIPEMGTYKGTLAIEAYTIGARNLQYKYTFLIVILISSFFFISQTLLRLYKYNMLKADFYYACADSLILTQKFNNGEKDRFKDILSIIISEKIPLTTPPTPNFSNPFTKDKEAN
jgi:hypothetical protein